MLNESRRKVGIAAFDSWRSAGMRNTVVLHTGMGKTFVGLDAAVHVNSLCSNNAKVVFFAETLQREQELLKDIEFYGRCYPDAVIPPIEFACYQSAYKWKNKEFDLGIYDEVHECMSLKYINTLLNNTYKYVIGLTATDGSDVTYILDNVEVKKVALMNKYLPVCFRYGLIDAVKDGNSRKLNIHIIHHRLDDTVKCIEAGTKNKQFLTTEQKAYKHFDSKFWQGIYEPALQHQVKIYMTKRAKLLYSLPSKFRAANEILNVVGGRTLIFANDLDALGDITHNIIRSPREGESKKERDILNTKIRDLFESGKTNVLASFKVLQQGANIKGGLDNLMIISYYSDLGKLIQRIGRLRMDGDKEGNVIIFVTLATQEEKWFKKMMSVINDSVFNVVKHADAESFIKTMKDERKRRGI